MKTEELIEFIKSEHQRLMNYYQIKDKSEATHPIMIKISEEVGELAEEVLLLNKLQRKEKVDARESKIGDELADVIITTLILAENVDIDIIGSLRKKIDKIKKRNY